MLPINLEAYAVAARWRELPEELVARDFQATCKDERFPGAVLPAVDTDGKVLWYGAAGSGSEWRQLRSLLQAYVGRTITDFTGESTSPDLTRSVEKFLQDAGVYAFARITPGDRCLEFAIHALDRLRMALKLRPTSGQRVPEPTSAILARLEMSLAAGARDDALRLLTKLRSELRLDTLNLHFLEVRIHSAFREWNELANAEWFGPLCLVRKPAAVASAMLEALWHARLARIEDQPDQLATEYREKVQMLARPLLAQISGQLHPATIQKLLALEAATIGAPSNSGVVAELLSQGANAQELLEQAADAPSSLRIAEAREAIGALPEAARETLVHSAAGSRALAELGALSEPTPTDWIAWLNSLPEPRFETATAVAREGATAWMTYGEFSAQQAGLLSHRLLEVGFGNDLAHERLIDSLPSLVRWVKEDVEYPRAVLQGVYGALLQLLALLERRDASTRDAAADLLDAFLTCGCTAAEYGRLLSDFRLLIDQGAGESSVYWLIDVAAILLHHPSPDVNARLVLLNLVLDSIQPLLAGLTPGQRASYNRISSSASWPTLPTPVSKREFTGADVLAGKSIAVYTLTESAGRQAELALQAMAPNVRVELAHDHVGSQRLVRLSREADVFVLTSASAKHAATDCILANRGKKTLLYASGRGFSSIVRAVEEYAQRGD
jgi:hypothetical protein